MRPIASTPVASMQNIAAPDSASVLICVKCQSLASPFTEEYWHIGATMMRLESSRPRSFIGENRALMGDFRAGGGNVVFLSNETRRFPQPCLEPRFWQNLNLYLTRFLQAKRYPPRIKSGFRLKTRYCLIPAALT